MDILFTLFAHVNPGAGAIDGFLHPLLGLDHLLAMLTVGLLSAQLGGRAIWTVPLAFVAAMAIGGALGLAGIQMPFVEYGIAVSVVILGIVLVAKVNLPEWLAMIAVAVFALFHGHAHGAELPAVDSPFIAVAYVIGFLVATAGLHVIGALIGYILLRGEQSDDKEKQSSPLSGAMALRVSGAVIALLGVWIFLGI